MAALRFVNLLLGAVLIGGMVMELLLILPTVRRLPRAAALQALQIMGPLGWRYLPVCGVGATAAGVGILLLAPDVGRPAWLLTAAGAALMTTGAAVNVTRYLPVDRRVRRWSVHDVPAELEATVAQLTRVHIARTVLFGGGFACFVAAAVTR